jgi:hypothetical protein
VSGTQKTLVAAVPGGTRVTKKTAGSYDTAGLLHSPKTGWFIAEVGWSSESVRKRTLTSYNRHPTADDWIVAPLREILPQAIENYYASYDACHRLRIAQIFVNGTWQEAGRLQGAYPGMSAIRALKREGVQAITVTIPGRCAGADFQMSELVPLRPAPRRRSETFLPHLGVASS